MIDNSNIRLAVKYLRDRGIDLPLEVLSSVVLDFPLTVGEKKRFVEGIKSKQINTRELKQAGSYQAIRNTFWANVYDSVYNFLNSKIQVRSAVESLVTALSQAWIETSDIAYVDGGGSLPLDEDTATYVRLDISSQSTFIDGLFARLKDLRKEKEFDPISEAFARANGYANSLDVLYNNVKTAGAGNKMLNFGGDDGKESCGDCQYYKGQRHRASWWIKHNAVPPNRDFECRGYRCEHRLYDDNGDIFTI